MLVAQRQALFAWTHATIPKADLIGAGVHDVLRIATGAGMAAAAGQHGPSLYGIASTIPSDVQSRCATWMATNLHRLDKLFLHAYHLDGFLIR
jgi:hypothetical protein